MAATFHISDALTATVSSVAVIGPDERRRRAVTSALAECQNGQLREFAAYPPSLDEVQSMTRNCNVAIIDLDSDPELALDLIENICVQGSAIAMVYSERPDADLMVRCIRAGAREFLSLPLAGNAMAEALVRASAAGRPQPFPRRQRPMAVFSSSWAPRAAPALPRWPATSP